MSRKKVSIIDQIRLTVMKLREEKGWSQTEFAEKLNISRSHMNKLALNVEEINREILKLVVDEDYHLIQLPDELIEWFASSIECPVIDVFSANQVQQNLPGEEYV